MPGLTLCSDFGLRKGNVLVKKKNKNLREVEVSSIKMCAGYIILKQKCNRISYYKIYARNASVISLSLDKKSKSI